METEQDSLSLSPSNDSPVNRETTPEPKQATLNNTNGPSCGDFDGSVLPNQNLTTDSQKQQLKKQIKRRILSRSYEEKLTNMAQVRREIVTALKIHRATKQTTVEQQQLPLPQQQQQESLSLKTSNVSSLDQDGRINPRRNPKIYPSCNTKISTHMNDFSFSLSHPPPPNSYPNTSHAITSSSSGNPPPKEENPNLTLPNQTLGLNLNSHPFNNSEAPPPPFLNNSNNDNTNSSLCSYTSLTPSSPPLVAHDQDVYSIETSHSQGEGVSSVVDKESNATIHHTAMNDEGMKEIRSLVKKHQMELDDTHSLITSIRWFNYLKNMEHGATHHEDGACQIFDELNEFPTWLNYYEDQVCLEQCSEDFQDPTILW